MSQSQNIFPNYIPQYNNRINSYEVLQHEYELMKHKYEVSQHENELMKHKYEVLLQKILELNNNKNANSNKENEEIKKIKKIYNKNMRDAYNNISNTLNINNYNIKNYNKDIIIYITNNNKIEFKKELNGIKAIKLKDLILPNISDNMSKIIEITKYKKTEEDNIILKENIDNNSSEEIFYNKFMFYSSNKISLYSPHIIKTTNNILSIYLNKEQKLLNISDFQYADYNKYIDNDIFKELLQKRIKEFNNLNKQKGIIIDDKYNDKIFGFNENICKTNYYLYSIMDQEIIFNKLKKTNYEELKNAIAASKSQINKENTYNNKFYEIFNKNMDYSRGLTFEELILYLILDKLEFKYDILPRIIFYEYYLTINGEKVVVSDKIEKGYSEIDYVLYSKCNYLYDNEYPLKLQEIYNYHNRACPEQKFEIKENTLYFFELKSSINLSENKEIYLKDLFNKYKEFIHLYESKGWIKKDTKKEIILIYDNSIYEISLENTKIIQNFVSENKDCTFEIVYSYKSYPFFTHTLAIGKYERVSEESKRVSEENNNLKLEVNKLNQKIEELIKRFEEQEKIIKGMQNKI